MSVCLDELFHSAGGGDGRGCPDTPKYTEDTTTSAAAPGTQSFDRKFASSIVRKGKRFTHLRIFKKNCILTKSLIDLDIIKLV